MVIQYELNGKILERTVYRTLGQTADSVIGYIKNKYPAAFGFKVRN